MHDELTRYFNGMRAYLRGGPADDLASVSQDAGAEANIQAGKNDAEGLALYRWLVLADRRALLEDAAPLARAAVQPDVWNSLTEDYVATVPTTEWDTTRYADKFSDFLAAKSAEGVAPPHVADLAEFAILRRRAFLSTVALGSTRLNETVFVRMFSCDVRTAHGATSCAHEPLEVEARPTVLIIYRSCTSGRGLSMDGTAARVVALLDALGEPVIDSMRESIPAELRVAALAELQDAGVLPRE